MVSGMFVCTLSFSDPSCDPSCDTPNVGLLGGPHVGRPHSHSSLSPSLFTLIFLSLLLIGKVEVKINLPYKIERLK